MLPAIDGISGSKQRYLCIIDAAHSHASMSFAWPMSRTAAARIESAISASRVWSMLRLQERQRPFYGLLSSHSPSFASAVAFLLTNAARLRIFAGASSSKVFSLLCSALHLRRFDGQILKKRMARRDRNTATAQSQDNFCHYCRKPARP